MQIRLSSLVAIAGITAALASCDGPTAVEPLLSPSFANSVDPNAPANLTATPVVPAQINLAWTAKSHNETGFQIYRSDGPTGGFSLLTTTGANVTTYADVALQPVNQQCYRVQGMAKTRVLGVSNTACAKPPVTPPAASNVSAIAHGATVNIAWTDNSVNESGFRIEVAGSAGGPWTTSEPSVGADITTAQRSAAGFEVEVCYQIIAGNEFGDAAPSNPACTTPLAAPTLTATGGQYDLEIKLTWSDNSSEEWYEISRSTSGGEWLVLSGVWANTTEYLDQNLSLGTEYSYRVRAMKGAGFSDYSNTAAATAVSGPPRAPAWVYIYVFGSTGVEVYWDVPYAFWEGTSNITGWKVERSPYGTDNWTVVDAANTSGYYDDWGLTPEETVCYRVSTLSAYGESEPTGGDYSCATPSDYYCCGAENASIGVNAPGSLLNRPTPLLDFGRSSVLGKSLPRRVGGMRLSNGRMAPSTARPGRTR